MSGGDDETGMRLAIWVAAPQFMVLGIVAVAASSVGFGWSLFALLALAAILSMAVAYGLWRLLLRWRDPPNVFVGGLTGLLAGALGAGLSFSLAMLDKEIGPHFGGALLDALLRAGVQAGAQAGFGAMKTGVGVVDVMTIPHRAVTGFFGGFIGAMLVLAAALFALGIPLVTGLIGGFSTAWRARRRLRRLRVG